ncbi:MAG: hypothetical protein WDA16_14725 [Candidatus Thermoplasmatota archaeon]
MSERDDRVRIMDVHAEPIAKASWDYFFAFFQELGKMRKHAILEGGWAVAAYGSPVASVDIDIIIREDEYDGDHDYYDLLHAEGRFEREVLSAVDWSFADFNAAWATTSGYDRTKLLKNRTRKTTLQAPDGRTQEVTIPTLPALLVMKLKAFRDRELQYRVMRDPAEIASFDPHEIQQIHSDEDHRLRKAAKDIVDIGYLWAQATKAQRQEAVTILRENKLRDLVAKAITACDPAVASAADYLIGKHSLRGHAGEIRDALLNAL